MTTPASGDAGAPGRIEFSTTDSERAIAYFNDVYRTSLRITGARDGHLYQHSGVDGGSFVISNVRVPLHIGVRRDPLDKLIIVQIGVGRIEREPGGVSERFLIGDVFVDSVPGLPATMRMLGVEAQSVMLDLGMLAQVAAASPARGVGPIRLTSFRPKSALAGLQWQRTVTFLRDVLENSEASAQPLIRGSAARMLAATVLTTFRRRDCQHPPPAGHHPDGLPARGASGPRASRPAGHRPEPRRDGHRYRRPLGLLQR